MKKLLISLGLCVAAFTTSGQNFESLSLLNVRAIATGTNGLGAGGVTNLSLLITNAGMVLSTNIVFTNNAGTVVRSSGLTNTVSTTALFKTVPFYVDRNGNPIFYSTTIANAGTSLNSNLTYFSSQNLLIELVNPYGTNGPIGMVFAPVWSPNVVAYDRTNDWSVIIAGQSGAKVSVSTNIPTWRWPGAYGLTVRYITNQFNITAADGTTNCPYLTKLEVTGSRP